MTVTIPLSRGQVAIVDDMDARLAAHSWSAHPCNRGTGGFYAARSERGTTVYMHRVILGAPKGLLVDHINGDGLDNRRANLRLATHSQNLMNRTTTSSSGFRGVEATGRIKRPWVAIINEGPVAIRIGVFETVEEAARAYDREAAARFGEFAKLNFPTASNDDLSPKREEAA